MDSGQEPYIQTLFNRFEEKHHEVMSDVEAAKRQCVLISCPVALHQFGLESLLLEETFFDRRRKSALHTSARYNQHGPCWKQLGVNWNFCCSLPKASAARIKTSRKTMFMHNRGFANSAIGVRL